MLVKIDICTDRMELLHVLRIDSTIIPRRKEQIEFYSQETHMWHLEKIKEIRYNYDKNGMFKNILIIV